MKYLLCLAFAGAMLHAQPVTITDTIKTPMGGNWAGTVVVTLNNPQTAQPLYSGSVTLSGWSQTVAVTNGAFSITLYPNDGITPLGTSYSARYSPAQGGGSAWSETWVVETGDTKILEIRVNAVPTPTTRFNVSQLLASGATSGQGLFFNGTAWAPRSVPLTITGTPNQITASGATGAITLSIPTNPTLPGTTTGTFSGNLTGNVTGNVTGSSGSTTGNAATATALQTARNIAGVSFDGTANINIPSTGLSDSSALVRGATNCGTAGQVMYTSSAGSAGCESGFAYSGSGANSKTITVTASTQARLFVVSGTRSLAMDSYGVDQNYLFGSGANTALGTATSHLLQFSTNNTERARFTAATGSFLLGTTADLGFGMHAAKSGTNGTFLCHDPTATTGSTSCVFRAGAGQSGNLTTWQNAAGAQLAAITSTGGITVAGDANLFGTYASVLAGSTYRVFGRLRIGATADGLAYIDNSDSSSRADLSIRSITSAGYAFTSLPAATNGTFLYCSDCTIASPCASGGTGALAKRLNSAWICN